MIARYNNLSLLLGVPGLILQIAGNVMRLPSEGAPAAAGHRGRLGGLLLLAGTVMLFFGLAYYAKAKGRSPAWCLMALLSLVGIIVLACLSDEGAQRVNRFSRSAGADALAPA